MDTPIVATDDAGVAAAVEVLTAGGVIVIPTDTVYGLAARAGDDDAVARLFALKGRRADVPIAVLCARATDALALAAPVTDPVRSAAARHWPGPLTLVVARRPDLNWNLGEPAATIGMRCPDHAFVTAVAAAVGPLATTSANRHGEPTPATAVAAAESLTGLVDLVVDGGTVTGTPSTVINVAVTPPVVLRQGELHVRFD